MKVLKWIVLISVTVVLLITIVLASVLYYIDPNDYKPQILELVKKETGRDIEINKPITLSVFPWLGLEVGGIKILNHPKYNKKLFASLGAAQVKVKIIPLFKNEIVVDTVVIKDLKAFLEINKQGINNWQDLQNLKKVDNKKSTKKPDNKLPKIALAGINIQNANLDYIDKSTNNTIKVRKCNLLTGAIDIKAPISLDFDCQVSLPKLTSNIKLSAQTKIDTENENYALNDLKLTIEAEGEKIPNKKQTINLLTNITVDLKKNTIQLTDFILKALLVELTGSINVLNLNTDPSIAIALNSNKFNLNQVLQQVKIVLPKNNIINLQLQTKSLLKPIQQIYNIQSLVVAGDIKSGKHKTPININAQANINLNLDKVNIDKLTINTDDIKSSAKININNLTKSPTTNIVFKTNTFNLKNILNKLQIKLPPMSDKNALQKLSVKFNGKITDKNVNIHNLLVLLDQSKINSSAKISNLQSKTSPAISFNTTINNINVDNYLPPISTTKKDKPKNNKTNKEDIPIDLPKELLKSLNIAGSLKIGTFQINKIKAQNVNLKIKAQNGDIKINQAKFNLYGGAFATKARLNVKNKQTKYNINGSFNNINIEPLLKALMEEDRILGKTKANFNITTAGESVNQLKSNLNGKVGFLLKNGAIKGFNLAKTLDEAKAKLKRQKIKKDKKYPQTDFSTASASLIFKNGVGYNKDLNLQAPLIRVGGRGSVNLKSDSLNYLAKVLLTDKKTGQSGKSIQQSSKLKIPIKIKGPFSNLDISILIADALKEQLNQALDQKKAELKNKLNKKVDAEKAKLKNKADKAKAEQKAKLKAKVDKEKQKQQDKLKNKLKNLF
ncbi:MAG: hypothetical protein DRQ51_03995 [Gammaproteobacteria bacterium]|nr:MAG: hypothetical protein DRQ51_03995 [Gammaproteobacteria bacterium]